MRPIPSLLLLSLSGCSFALDFGEFTTAERDAGGADAADAGGAPDGGDGGSAVPDGCVESDEVCNGVDDDCDGETDEAGFGTDDPRHCGGCGIACASGYACLDGTCENQVVELAGGGDFTCARNVRGEVWCWGDNAQGQIGTGMTGGTVAMPRLVTGVATDRSIGAGGSHTCAATADRTHCWGDGSSGQLGNGGSSSAVPTGEVGTAALQVALGDSHTCILTGTARVTCAGANTHGATGTDDATHNWFDTGVDLPTAAADVTAGAAHSCAVLTDDRVYCWGLNANRQLGVVATGGYVPQLVTGAVDVKDVEAGFAHTCGIVSGGGVLCWGGNSVRQLGLGATSPTELPTAVPALAGQEAVQLALGRLHSCALLANGEVWCWGFNEDGQLGVGDADSVHDPGRVDSLPPARAIAAGESHTCAALVTPEVRCWGANGEGQLGTGSPSASRSLPQRTELP